MRKTIVIGVAIAFAIGISPSDAEAWKLFGGRGKAKPAATSAQPKGQRVKGFFNKLGKGIATPFQRAWNNEKPVTFADRGLKKAGAMMQGAANSNGRSSGGKAAGGTGLAAASTLGLVPQGIANGAVNLSVGGAKLAVTGFNNTVAWGGRQVEKIKNSKAAARVEVGVKRTKAAGQLAVGGLRNLSSALDQQVAANGGYSGNVQKHLGGGAQQVQLSGDAAKILGTLNSAGRPMGYTSLAKTAGMSKARVKSAMGELGGAGVVQQIPGRGWGMTPGLSFE